MVTYIGPGQKGGVGDVKLEAVGLEGRAAGRGLVLASLAQIRVVPACDDQSNYVAGKTCKIQAEDYEYQNDSSFRGSSDFPVVVKCNVTWDCLEAWDWICIIEIAGNATS